MNIENIHPKDGDVVILIGAKDPQGTGAALQEMLRKTGGVNCGVLSLPEGATIETADEDRMFEIGWVRREGGDVVRV